MVVRVRGAPRIFGVRLKPARRSRWLVVCPRGATLIVRAEITAGASIWDIVDCAQIRCSDRLPGEHCALGGLASSRSCAQQQESKPREEHSLFVPRAEKKAAKARCTL